MGELLKNNHTLEKLKFSESTAKQWTDESKDAFIQMLKQNKMLTKVTFIPCDKNDPNH